MAPESNKIRKAVVFAALSLFATTVPVFASEMVSTNASLTVLSAGPGPEISSVLSAAFGTAASGGSVSATQVPTSSTIRVDPAATITVDREVFRVDQPTVTVASDQSALSVMLAQADLATLRSEFSPTLQSGSQSAQNTGKEMILAQFN